MSHIKNTCVDTYTLVKYKMPLEFYGRIDKDKFWGIIISFITRNMGFEDHNLGEWKAEQVYDSDYEYLEYGEYFLMTEKKYEGRDDYVEDYVAIDIRKIDKIVFRIYKK